MRKTCILLVMLGALTACNNNKGTEPVKLDPDSKIYISCQTSKADENGLETAEYIVRNCAYMRVKPIKEGAVGRMDLGLYEDNYEAHRDLANNRFILYGSDAVTEEGQPGIFFQFEDVTFSVAKINGKRVHPFETPGTQLDQIGEDTIAYIPNAIIKKAQEDIMQAIAEGDSQKAYQIMMDGFVFIPIKDGAEWRRLEGKE